ncbi:hypothetical protein GOP47_0028675 [Adiantum capillus-veneris]|nr:hypothetical protein GOP47_0028675 [Adiantum capillus-veneris]
MKKKMNDRYRKRASNFPISAIKASMHPHTHTYTHNLFYMSMAEWVKKRMKLQTQTLVVVVKDQLSIGRTIVNGGQLTQIDLAVLPVTNHEEQAIQEGAVSAALSLK